MVIRPVDKMIRENIERPRGRFGDNEFAEDISNREPHSYTPIRWPTFRQLHANRAARKASLPQK